MLPDNRATRARVHLDRLVANYRMAGELAGGAEVMAILKADAYGHGAVICARTLQQTAGCRSFGVATLDEAIELRAAGITGDILLMGALFPGDEEEAIRNGIACAVYDDEVARRLNAAAARLGERVPVHLKIETGMSRLGFEPAGFSAFVRRLSDFGSLAVHGIFTHLAEADRPDGYITAEQYALLSSARDALVRGYGEAGVLHAMNSSALLQKRQPFGDVVRPGIMLYGAYPSPWQRANVTLQPVLELVSSIVQIRRLGPGRKVSYGGGWIAGRDSLVGVVPAGYADGVPRLLSNRGEVLVGHRRVPILGRVCMDMFMVDLTDVDGVAVGDEVTLIGRQGDQEVTTDEWAAWAQTIPYEILTGLTRRVARVYVDPGAESA